MDIFGYKPGRGEEAGMKNQRIGMDLTTGPILPALLVFVLPIFLSNTIQ